MAEIAQIALMNEAWKGVIEDEMDLDESYLSDLLEALDTFLE